jgi:hypothetical protein
MLCADVLIKAFFCYVAGRVLFMQPVSNTIKSRSRSFTYITICRLGHHHIL